MPIYGGFQMELHKMSKKGGWCSDSAQGLQRGQQQYVSPHMCRHMISARKCSTNWLTTQTNPSVGYCSM